MKKRGADSTAFAEKIARIYTDNIHSEIASHASILSTVKAKTAGGHIIGLDEGLLLIDQCGILVLEESLLNIGTISSPLNRSGFSLLYSLSYSLTCQKGSKDYSRELYEYYDKVTCRYLQRARGILSAAGPTELLGSLCHHWKLYLCFVKWIWRMFMHLDRGIIASESRPSLIAVSLKAFYETVFLQLMKPAVTQFVRCVALERDGDSADHELLAETSKLFKVMGVARSIRSVETLEKALSMENDSVYKEHLADAFVEGVDTYYAQKGALWVDTLETLAYLQKVEESLHAEEGHVRAYMVHTDTLERTRRAVLVRLVVNPKVKFLEILSEVLRRCRNETKLETLSISDECMSLLCRLYKLSASATALDPQNEDFDTLSAMAKALSEHVSTLGDTLLSRYHVSKVNSNTPPSAIAGGASFLGGAAVASATANAVPSLQASATTPSTAHTSSASTNAGSGSGDIDTHFVENLLRIYSHGRQIVQNVFDSNASFDEAHKNGMASFINKELPAAAGTGAPNVATTPVQLLAAYCDKALKGVSNLSESDVESLMDTSVNVLTLMTDKDIFAEVYRTHMAKRLLTRKSSSMEAERAMVARLKLKLGAPFTSKIEGMLYDVMLTDEMQREFEPEFHKQIEDQPVFQELKSFSVQVLSTFSWPTQKIRDVILPPLMEACKSTFTQWYTSKYYHRALKWVYTLGEATIGAYLGNKSYEMQVTTLQAVVLSAFDGNSMALSFPAIQEKTGITDTEVLKRVLHSLSCQKFKILIKGSQSKSVLLTDTFHANNAFSNALRKFRVPMASLDDAESNKSAKDLHDQQQQTVTMDRGAAIDAAIVRIMKAHNVLNHAQLQSEVISQVKYFVPEPKMIKQRIEGLIDRDYLQRDEKDLTLYTYLP